MLFFLTYFLRCSAIKVNAVEYEKDLWCEITFVRNNEFEFIVKYLYVALKLISTYVYLPFLFIVCIHFLGRIVHTDRNKKIVSKHYIFKKNFIIISLYFVPSNFNLY